jgi:hypothetical protein
MEMFHIKKLLIKLFNNDFTVKSRRREIVYQRAVYYKLCMDYTCNSLSVIGESVDINHATVIHGLKIFKNLEFWKEDEYLDIYKEAKRRIETRRITQKSYQRKTYKQKYSDLLMRHINLKQNYAEIKTTLEKIS